MAALLYKDDHNKVAYLEKGKGWEAYEQILDFINRSHIQYALTHHPPIVFDSLVKQFWAAATVHTHKAWPSEIIATIDGNEVVVTESLIRTQLQLNDETGLYEFTLHDVLDGMREIGYPTDGSLTFYTAKISPQWRFLIHFLIHCMSPKSGGWNQFPSSIASALICMSTNRTYNFSRFILDGMIGNIGSKRHKFLMYPRFLQMILGIQTTDPSPRPTFDFTAKLFSNIKLNWDGPHMPMLAPMLVVPAGGDGADAAAAGAAAANEVPPPPPPPAVLPTHTSSSTLGPSTIAQDTPVRDPTPVREPTPMREPTLVREPTPRLVREPTTFWEPTPGPPSPPPFIEDISEDGGGYVSSPKSNEAPPTTSSTAAGGAEDSVALTDLSLKLDRVKRLEGILQQRKRRLLLSYSEGEDAATKEQEINLDALHELASTSLGGDTTVKAAYTIYKASQDAHASLDAGPDEDEVPDTTNMPFRRTRTKRRQLRKTFTSFAFKHFQENVSAVEDTISAGAGIPADAQTIPTGITPIPTTGGVSVGSSMDPVGQAAAAAPSSSAIPAADKGKASMVDDSIHADLLTEQEREAEFARKQEELKQKAQAESVASPAAQDWLELMAKIATNSALSRQLLGDDVNEDNINERLSGFYADFVKNQSASVYNQGWTMKQVKALSNAQLKHEFEYIQRNLKRSNLLNFKRTTFRPKPTFEAPSVKRARQGVPPAIHAASSQVSAASSQVPAGVPAAPSSADVSVSAVSTTTADVFAAPTTTTSIAGGPSPSVAEDPTTPTQVPPVTPDLATVSAHADTEVHADESCTNDNKTASEQVSAEHIVNTSTIVAFTSGFSHATHLSSRKRRKQLAKKRVTPIVDVANDALIKFDNASESDDDASPYAPYAGWEMVPTPFGSIHSYYDMEEHTKHITFLRELLHMVEKNDLKRLLGKLAYSPLAEATLERMLRHGLEVPKLLVGGDLTMAEQLVTQNWMVITFHVPFWNEKWLVQGGTALELASPEQTATGKDVSNLFMAVMVCQKPLGYFSSPMIDVSRARLVIHPPG
nr:hypothetical protein [Tanacetum cinerariifolium]